jgi:hypothetical protein
MTHNLPIEVIAQMMSIKIDNFENEYITMTQQHDIICDLLDRINIIDNISNRTFSNNGNHYECYLFALILEDNIFGFKKDTYIIIYFNCEEKGDEIMYDLYKNKTFKVFVVEDKEKQKDFDFNLKFWKEHKHKFETTKTIPYSSKNIDIIIEKNGQVVLRFKRILSHVDIQEDPSLITQLSKMGVTIAK